MSQIKHMLTFDIEDWYHVNYSGLDSSNYELTKSNFPQNMHKLLEICANNDAQATFFTLGIIGERFPEIIKEIVAQGHELASHGYSHELAYNQTMEEFKEDVKKSLDILQNITGMKICGYRAPSWSIVKRNYHYLTILEELGLCYDASVFPAETFLYGIDDAPQKIYQPVVGLRQLNLYEVPMSVQTILGRKIGYSGGFYLRLFPAWLIKYFIRCNEKQKKYTILYLHPRELDPKEQRLKLDIPESFIHYYNISATAAKLNDVLLNFKFTSIKNYLDRHKKNSEFA